MPHSGQLKLNLRQKKALSRLEGLLEIMGLEVMTAEGVRAGTCSEGWRRRIADGIGAATLKL